MSVVAHGVNNLRDQARARRGACEARLAGEARA
jgi:hypothetical protein